MPVGILLPYFLLLRMQSFSHHGATCVEVPHFANLIMIAISTVSPLRQHKAQAKIFKNIQQLTH